MKSRLTTCNYYQTCLFESGSLKVFDVWVQSRENDSMKTSLLFMALLITSCGSGTSGDGKTKLTPGGSAEESAWTNEFMDLVNAHRAQEGLRSLTENDEMSEIAEGHSLKMATGDVGFGHTGFSGRCSAARSALGGGNWCGENVARGQSTPAAVFNSWLNSPAHRDNLENPRATHMGLGFARNPSGGLYWTQLFLER